VTLLVIENTNYPALLKFEKAITEKNLPDREREKTVSMK